jgi:hypothetical protein
MKSEMNETFLIGLDLLSGRTPTGWIVATAGHGATSDRDVSEGEIRTRTLSTENVVVLRSRGGSSSDVLEEQALNEDAVGRVSSWTAVEVVLLHINAVNGDTL